MSCYFYWASSYIVADTLRRKQEKPFISRKMKKTFTDLLLFLKFIFWKLFSSYLCHISILDTWFPNFWHWNDVFLTFVFIFPNFYLRFPEKLHLIHLIICRNAHNQNLKKYWRYYLLIWKSYVKSKSRNIEKIIHLFQH